MHSFAILLVFTIVLSAAKGIRWEEEAELLKDILSDLEAHEARTTELRTVGGEYKFFAQLLTKLPKGIVSLIECQKSDDLSEAEITRCKAIRDVISKVAKHLKEEDKHANAVVSSVDWKTLNRNVGKIFDVISSVEAEMLMFLEAPLDVASMFQDMFQTSYQIHLNQPALMLKNLMLEESTPISLSMLDRVREMKKNDMREMYIVAGFVIRNLLRSLEQETAFLALTGKHDNLKTMQQEWVEIAAQIAKRGEFADKAIWDSWSYQSYLDVDQIGQSLEEETTVRETADSIHGHLESKFPNRKWFVLAHSYTGNSDKDRYYTNCHDYTQRFQNKVVVVNSVDARNKAPMTKLRPILSPIADYEDGFSSSAVIAKELFGRFNLPPCGDIRFVGSVEAKSGPEVRAPSDHLLVRLIAVKRTFHSEKPYFLFAFA